jgi:hypothetical protein
MPDFLEDGIFTGRYMLDFLEYARFFGICQIISWSMPDFLEYA